MGAGRAGTRRCAVRGVAGPGKGAGRALCPALVCRRTEYEELRVSGARRGTECACPSMPMALVPAALYGWAGVPTHPWFRGGDAGPTPGSTSAPTLASRSWLAQAPGRPLLRHLCSVAGRSFLAGAVPHGSGAPRGPAAEWSSAAVWARSQEPAARSLAPARPLACSFLNLK